MSEYDGITNYMNTKTYLIKYVSKEEMPAKGSYGFCDPTKKEIFILDSLPDFVKKSVLAHEKQHEKDYENGISNELWLEIKANLIGFIKYPIGFIGCFFMSLFSIERWKLYIRRITQ